VDPLPKTIEHGWLIEGPDRDPTYLMEARIEVTHDGIWRVRQRICGYNEQKTSIDYTDETEARAHWARILDYGRAQEGTRWKISYD
jgi:hypothetical protein